MVAKYLILLLPALVYAKINVNVAGKFTEKNQEDLIVSYFGKQVDIITDKERNTFKLTDSNLKNAVNSYFGKRPDDAYLKSPTPWGDLYNKYSWRQVIRTLVPRRARILGISTQPAIVMEQIFENNSTKSASFNAGISQQVADTVTSSWSKGGELEVGQEIEYKLDIGVAGAGGKTSVSYTAVWGEDYEKSRQVTVGATSAMTVSLKPTQAIIAKLEATRGTIKVEVEYEASLSGVVAVNYNSVYNGHHFWSLDVAAVMSKAGFSNRLTSKEIIEIGFYTKSRVVLLDYEEQSLVMAVDF